MLLFCQRVAFSLSLQTCVCVAERGREPEKIPVTASVNVFVLERMCVRCQRGKKGDNYIIL